MRTTQWILLAIGYICVGIIAVILGNRFYDVLNLAKAGCYPWSAAEVEFHQGMTICPNQTARTHIMIPIMPAQRDIMTEEKQGQGI